MDFGSEIKLSQDGLLATVLELYLESAEEPVDLDMLVTGGPPMSDGRHYWELQVSASASKCSVFVGAVRPGLDHEDTHCDSDGAWYLGLYRGGLYRRGHTNSEPQGAFAEGDRVGVLLDLDAGWLRFYRNSKRCGPGFTEGVTGPLVRAAQVYSKGDALTVLPGAVAPEGAGAADEPWEAAPANNADY